MSTFPAHDLALLLHQSREQERRPLGQNQLLLRLDFESSRDATGAAAAAELHRVRVGTRRRLLQLGDLHRVLRGINTLIHRRRSLLVLVQSLQSHRSVPQLEHAGSHRHGDTHDDALAHAVDGIRPSVQRRVEQVVRGLLERRQHQHAVLHLRHAEPGDTQHLALVRHHVGEEHRVPRVDGHAVRLHRVVDLFDDARPRGFDAQRALSLHDVVGGGVRPFDALDSHDSLQVDPLDDEVVLAATHVVDDGSGHARNALHDDVGNSRAQRLQVEQRAPIRGGALRGVGFSLGLLVGG